MNNYLKLTICFIFVAILIQCGGQYVRTTYVHEPIVEPPVLNTYAYHLWGVSGVHIDVIRDTVIVTKVANNFPAEKAGIKRNDRIIAINGKSTVGKPIDDVSQMLRGETGSSVSLTVVDGYGALKTITYNRGISNGWEPIESPQSIIKFGMVKTERKLRIHKDIYERDIYTRKGGCSFQIFLPPTYEKITGKDTIYEHLPLPYTEFYVDIAGEKGKIYKTDKESFLKIDIKDFYEDISVGSEMVLSIRRVDGQLGTATLNIPAAYWEFAKKRDNEATKLYATAQFYRKQGKYRDALSICVQIFKEYEGTYVGEVIKKNDEIDNLKNAIIKQDLDRMVQLDLTDLDDFLKKCSVQKSIWTLVFYLEQLPTSVQILAVVSGLGLQYNENQAWGYFQKLNAYQRLYAVLRLVELTVGNEPLYKAEMLKDWFGSSVANKLAHVSSKMMEIFSEKK